MIFDLNITIWTIWLFSIAHEFPDSKRRIYCWYPWSCKTVGVYIWILHGTKHWDFTTLMANWKTKPLGYLTWRHVVGIPLFFKYPDHLVNYWCFSSCESTGMWSIVQVCLHPWFEKTLPRRGCRSTSCSRTIALMALWRKYNWLTKPSWILGLGYFVCFQFSRVWKKSDSSKFKRFFLLKDMSGLSV